MPDDPIGRAAEVSIGRGSAFAALGIAITMAGLAFDLVLALRTGAALALLLAAGLAIKALRAASTRYKQTEAETRGAAPRPRQDAGRPGPPFCCAHRHPD